MKFSQLANYLDKLEKTASRNEITQILAEVFKKAKPEEIDKVVYLFLGQLAPSYQGIVFNIAERMMLRVLSEAYGKEVKEVRSLYKREGDLGNVAQELAKGKGRGLTVSHIYDELVEIAKDEGLGSQERKVKRMAKLLSELDPLSARFVVRIPVGKLRLGFSDKTILDALSWMEKGDKSAKSDIEKAYYVTPDVGALAKKVKKVGIAKAASETTPVLGVPILPMLAQRIKSPAEMIKKMGKVGVEPKLDGLRIQIHFKRGFVKAYTRNLNETSWMFPELKNLGKYVKGSELILDTEAIGLDEKTKTLVNFQTTMTRRRKHEIERVALKVKIKFYVFDILFKDGKSLMDKSYLERRKVLEKTVKNGPFTQVVDYQVTESPEEISSLNIQKRKEGLEGIILKKTDSLYVPGRTGWRWVKMKEAEKAHAKLADTIDCIVMGYTAGKGRRVQFGVGQFLVGVRNKEKIKTLTKVGTGLTDEQFRELKRRLSKLETKEKPKEYVVHKNLEPDYWVEPKLVVEIAADEITKSPTHSSGLALRFPRLIRFRDDKSLDQATTTSEVKKLFQMQKG
ncbi:ATP-dependent DNA ligase [Candidatus Woesebacteria bacterium]|nr:MAG: ATP-dependent DNA ligase [Candidatus Woesebacteria bacterium]